MAEAHIRIDEGIKRGPKNRYKHKSIQKPDEDALRESIPNDLDPDRVLDLYLSAPRTSQIAAKLGIKRSTLTWWMRKVRPEQWKQVQILRALMKKESADEGLEDAVDALSLARARELLRSGQWDLERLDSANYGVKQEVVHSGTVTISHALQQISQARLATQQPNEVIDLQPDAVQQIDKPIP